MRMKKSSIYGCAVLFLFNDIVAQMLYDNPEFVGEARKQYTEEEMTTVKETCVAEMAKLGQSTSKIALFILIYLLSTCRNKIFRFTGLFYFSLLGFFLNFSYISKNTLKHCFEIFRPCFFFMNTCNLKRDFGFIFLFMFF